MISDSNARAFLCAISLKLGWQILCFWYVRLREELSHHRYVHAWDYLVEYMAFLFVIYGVRIGDGTLHRARVHISARQIVSFLIALIWCKCANDSTVICSLSARKGPHHVKLGVYDLCWRIANIDGAFDHGLYWCTIWLQNKLDQEKKTRRPLNEQRIRAIDC